MTKFRRITGNDKIINNKYPEYQPPNGFYPHKNYLHGEEINMPGVAVLQLDNCKKLAFWVEEDNSETPVLPLLISGEIWHEGWDIPTRYAIDANKNCYMDSAHGGFMMRVTKTDLIKTAQENFLVLKTIHKALGKKPPKPAWLQEALNSGWTPPKNWKDSDYD